MGGAEAEKWKWLLTHEGTPQLLFLPYEYFVIFLGLACTIVGQTNCI